ncbi:hypothetical protein [Acinetobacter sp.]|uniref:phage major capsid protein n=1 Tax=Acinetobacter sp. TaxID=472 RepID=UPI003D025CCE
MKVISKQNPTLNAIESMLYDAFTNNGIVGLEAQDKSIVQLDFKDIFELPKSFKQANIDLKDTVTTKDLTRFIETTVSRVIREAIEPNLVVTPNLFQEVRYEGAGRSVEIGGIGAFYAATVPEGSEYPEVEFNFADGNMVMVGIEKHGLKMRVTEEVISDNLFDVFGLWLRMAGRALARHKEQYGIKLINEFGYDIFNNDIPLESEIGATNGRGLDGSKNSTMTVDDLFEMYAWMYLRGFIPDTMLMNPLAWKMFMTDPETREIVLKGATIATNNLPGGSYSPGFGTTHGGLGLRTTATGVAFDDPNKVAGNNPFVTTLNPLGASFNLPPKYLPSPMRVIVSPHIPYTPADVQGGKAKTNIIMADSSRCGILLTKEGISLDEWNDPERDLKAMKIKERWGMALFEQGKGVAIARNISIDRNYSFENVNQVTLS